LTTKPTLCIIDIIGLTYDAHTIEKYGLGGSESAVIYMAKELTNLGFEVTVFNNCIDSRSSPGIYEGVIYRDLMELDQPNNYSFDVMVASRSIIPFVPSEHYGDFNYPAQKFERIRESAKMKILWLHDTFCSGDHLVEEYLTRGFIDQAFTLSDFHTSYFATCNHGRPRNFEVLKNKIFMTRNGVKIHGEEVDVTLKDPNLFVYNASVSKGMVPLLSKVWPKVKAHIPEAKLKVIGGYYRFRDNAPIDEQEQTFHDLKAWVDTQPLDVEFTGIIPQSIIADILAKATFTIYPAAFPETFGISTLESLSYNTPIITNRFGALEETAVANASYMIDYAIQPNSLFPTINLDAQVEHFVEMVCAAHANKYLLLQKQQYCNIVKGWCGWDGVALQWKQQIYRTCGWMLSRDEFRRVDALNRKVHKVFGRRFSNAVEWTPQKTKERPIVVVSPFYNSAPYLEQHIRSVAEQDYDNVHHFLIDDCSTESNTDTVIERVLADYPSRTIEVYRREENAGALANQLSVIQDLKHVFGPEAIVVLLDGDDWLMPDNTIFTQLNALYDEGATVTYGSMWSLADAIPLIGQPYPKSVQENKTFKQYRFPWGIPYTHLRTFSLNILPPLLPEEPFRDENGVIYKAGGDGALLYYLLEQAPVGTIRAVQDVWVVYNDINPLNDYKVNGEEQNKNAKHILTK